MKTGSKLSNKLFYIHLVEFCQLKFPHTNPNPTHPRTRSKCIIVLLRIHSKETQMHPNRVYFQ